MGSTEYRQRQSWIICAMRSYVYFSSFYSFSAADRLNEYKTHVVIGPFDTPISLATEALNITYIATTGVTSKDTNSTFQIAPKLDDFSKALLDLVKHYDWKKVSVFFDDDKGLYYFIIYPFKLFNVARTGLNANITC